MKTILNIVTLIVVAGIGYVIFKAFQALSSSTTAGFSALNTAISPFASVASDANSAYNAVTGLFSDTPDPDPLANDPLTQMLNNSPTNIFTGEGVTADDAVLAGLTGGDVTGDLNFPND